MPNFNIQTYGTQELNLLTGGSLFSSQLFTNQSCIEFFVYSPNEDLLFSEPNFYQYIANSIPIDNGTPSSLPDSNDQNLNTSFGISSLFINPSQSLLDNGFDQGTYIAHYNFLNKKIGSSSEHLYITEISNDRKEVKLDTTSLSALSLTFQTTQFIQERQESNYFVDFYLNFGENNLILANNIILNSQDSTNPTIFIKLYEPLPDEFDINSICWVVTTLAESQSYTIVFDDPVFEVNDTVLIQGPNFNINIKDQINNSTLEYSYIDLISTSLTSSLQQLNSLFEEKEIDINVDYTNFNEYIHFSSAETRLRNFYYKIQLIEQYSSSIAILNHVTNSNISGSILDYQSKIDNIITNFDGYDYFLFYENNPYTWPKTNTEKPYELAKSNTPQVLSWIGSTNESSPYYGGLLLSASIYDNENKDNLLYSIPEYLRDDPNNAQYELFVQMVAQFYDNIWIYYKDVTEKYNADNRLEYGISKDLVADAIRDFGVKLYQNNFSNEDLYTAFLGLTPQGGLFPFPNITGSLPTPFGFEYIDQFISASNDYMPLDDVNKSLYKRIYHNLPYLLKTKGTLPGLRALITSYGIPDTILRINEYGGKDKVDSNDWDYWQNEFNYALGHNPLSSSYGESGTGAFAATQWGLNHSWNSQDNFPSTVMFRFKPFIPETKLVLTGSANLSVGAIYPSGNLLFEVREQFNSSSIVTLGSYEYSDSGSYSGSLYGTASMNPYSTLTFYPGFDNMNPTSFGSSSSLYLPFYDGGWWSLMITRNGDEFNIYAGNKIYEGGDNGTKLGFFASSSITTSNNFWNTGAYVGNVGGAILYAYNLDPTGSGLFAGSVQELRYYNTPISESVFKDFIMNPSSIEGNSLNSAPNELAFRAPLGNELYEINLPNQVPPSIHPKVTGSWAITQSFSGSDSTYQFYGTLNPNTEYFFYDQPIAGIRNAISDKIRIENNVMPEGDTLSPFMSLSQKSNISQSYTQNVNYLEVAFSPTNEINEDIMDQIGSFNIGEFIGDPRLRSSSAVTYPALDQLRNEYFQKYIKNYDLVDFIRLIKFFDNSLFKMIRDFVPARTSLASGIVIKQHLLERNKYPQPQVDTYSTIAYKFDTSLGAFSFAFSDEFDLLNYSLNTPITFQDISITGTLAPQWNDYQPGTVENFSGGTGGTFEQFNGTFTSPSGSNGIGPENQYFLTQSWYETSQTLSGSVNVLHDAQDEFYDGEFSGSVILVSDGILNEAYPINLQPLKYRQVHYYPTSSNEDNIFENLFLNSITTPQSGSILFYNEPFTFGGPPLYNLFVTKYLKIARIDCDGNNNTIVLENINKASIYNPLDNTYVPYNLILINEQPDYYLYSTLNSYIPSFFPNQVLDYTVSASIINPITTTLPSNPPLILTPTASINILNYYDSSSGYTTFANTPNTALIITASVTITNPGVTTPSIALVYSTPDYSTIVATLPGSGYASLPPGSSTYTISGSFYSLTNNSYVLSLISIPQTSVTIQNIQFLLTQSRAVSTSSCENVIFEPYITTPNFYNSDENALLNNAFELRDSSYYMDVDYTRGIIEPVNFDQLISGSATRAKVQDSNYDSFRHTIPRYFGSKNTSNKINEPSNNGFNNLLSYVNNGYAFNNQSNGDPAVESLKSYIAYGYMDGSWAPERMNASAFTIKYLIDQDGNISTPNISDISLPNTQQNFHTGDKFRYASILGQSSLNNTPSAFRKIIRGGYRIEPILYTQKGVAPNVTWEGILFESLLPTSTNSIGDYAAQFLYVGSIIILSAPFPQSTTINYNSTIYGSSFLTGGGYQVPQGAVDDAVSLTIKVDVTIAGRSALGNVLGDHYYITLRILKGTQTVIDSSTTINASGQNDSQFRTISLTIPPSDLNAGDIYTFKVTCDGSTTNYPWFTEEVYIKWSQITVSQTPPYVPPSAYTGSIWGYLDPINYPYIITSSVSEIVESYGVNIKQSDISQSGFNPITLPWSIEYGDEFRFEGREDFVYQVGKIFPSGDSGSGRISQTGSIEVHFNANLPVSASSSAFNLDHFLIRRYVEDSSQIIFEGFRPANGASPNSFIITPEYVVPQLNENTDKYIQLLTEKGLIG